ncbi:Bax inhibitor-1/YccA family protein [Nocardioides sp. KR10-350]|uniref:Bax inhibitor-1/YccA family protein n=1 Tax=Nocardioides cheoyonin TaxID=3156615 RepID=UPI0032B34CAB
MQSNNPVFRNSEGFSKASYNAYGNPTYAGNGTAYPGYGQAGYTDPSSWSVGGPAAPGYAPAQERMTIDSVVQKGAISIVLVVLAAAATWLLTPDVRSGVDLGPLSSALVLGGGVAFVLSLVNSFKRSVSPALVVLFAIAEGVSIGAFSKLIDGYYGGGLVVQAVLGTFAAFAGTLAAYKFLDIKVGNKFRTFVVAAVFGMVGLSLLELVLGLFGASFGLFGLGGIGIFTAIAGLVLGVFMLILDFDMVENGVANGLPEQESWRAAFAITVSLVWIYTNLLRLLAILQQD